MTTTPELRAVIARLEPLARAAEAQKAAEYAARSLTADPSKERRFILPRLINAAEDGEQIESITTRLGADGLHYVNVVVGGGNYTDAFSADALAVFWRNLDALGFAVPNTQKQHDAQKREDYFAYTNSPEYARDQQRDGGEIPPFVIAIFLALIAFFFLG
jgi:hypothetical protein